MCVVIVRDCSEQLDAIALKKLVQFVNELMELYFSYVQQRVQLEVRVRVAPLRVAACSA